MNLKLVINVLLVTLFLFISPSILVAQEIPEEALRYMSRGEAAVEMATSKKDYQNAISEFEKAKSLAPDFANIYYNLGFLYEKVGDFANAKKSYATYLVLEPGAEDAVDVKSKIFKIEYRMEEENKKKQIVNRLAGRWHGRYRNGMDRNPDFAIKVQNNRILVEYFRKTFEANFKDNILRFKTDSRDYIWLVNNYFIKEEFELTFHADGRLEGIVIEHFPSMYHSDTGTMPAKTVESTVVYTKRR